MTRARRLTPVLFLLAAQFCAPERLPAAAILMVTRDSGTLTSQESDRKSQFEAWGHTVATIDDRAPDAQFEAAAELAQLVYVSEEVNNNNLSSAVRAVRIGVVTERRAWDDDLGMAVNGGGTWNGQDLDVLDNSHPVTAGLPIGLQAIAGSSQRMIELRGALAPGGSLLATVGGDPALLVVDTGGSLANTIDSDADANGRRVRLPWGDGNFDWNQLNAAGLQLAQNAVSWASEGAGANASVFAASSPKSLNDIDWSASPLMTVTEQEINYASTNGEMIPGSPRDNFGVRITADVFVPASGSWTFYTRSDDGSRLYIDGEEVVNNDGLHGMRERSGAVTLAAGWHALRVDFFERGGGAGVIASWAGPGVGKQVIPRASLRPSIGNSGLVGHWRFDELAGTNAADVSGNARNATADAPVEWVGGVRGGAVRLNGSQTFSVPHDDGLNLKQLTIAAWMRPAVGLSSMPGEPILLEKHQLSSRSGYRLGAVRNNRDDFGLRLLDGSWKRNRNELSIEEAAFGDWVHMAGTYDGQTFRLYRNGEPVASHEHALLIKSSALDLLIGRAFVGDLDDVRLYGGALSDGEVAALYGLVGRWRFDDGSGTIAADISGNENDGQLQGDAQFATACNGEGVLQLDGVGDHVSVADDASLRFEGDSTLTGWFRLDQDFGPTSASFFLADKYRDNNRDMHLGFVGSDFNRSYVPKGALVFKMENRGYSYNWTATTEWPAGVWRHVALVVDSSDPGNARVYLDGVNDTASGVGSGSSGGYDFSAPLRFGGVRNERLRDRTFPGQMHDWRLYNRALSEDEIRKLSGRLLHWKFDESTGQIASDTTGNGYDGDVLADNDWVSGMVDGAIELHGDDRDLRGYVQNTRVAGSINGLDAITVSAWVRSDVTNQDRGIFIGKRPNGRDDLLGLRYDRVGSINRDRRILRASLRTTDGQQVLESLADAQTTSWQHVALVWRAGSDLDLYLDGLKAVVNRQGERLDGVVSGVTELRVGVGAKSRYWDGLIDDFRIYRRALCPSEIADLAGAEPSVGPRIVRWIEIRNP